MMTVGELIAELSKYDNRLEVFINPHYDDNFSDTIGVSMEKVESSHIRPARMAVVIDTISDFYACIY